MLLTTACLSALQGPHAFPPTHAAARVTAMPRMDIDKGTVNVGVIGAGRIGLVHLEALARCSNANPIIISNPTLSKAEAAVAPYPGMAFTSDDKEVINHPDVEAVWICSPSQFHSEQITACADAGKHIFCEKPLATDLKETVAAVNYARRKGVKLMTALQRRFDPNFSRIKDAITKDEVGEPITVKLCSRDPAPPPYSYVAGGGGLFKDMAVHDLDMARFLMGCEPVKVLATGACNIDKSIMDLPGPEAFDTSTIVVRFENGKDAIIDVCRQAPYGYDQRAEVLGTKGMVMSENMTPSTVRKFTDNFVGQADMPYDFFMSRYKEAYRIETEAFIDALVNDEPAPCSGRDGLVALVMAMAAGLSAEEQRWVDFGEIIEQEFGTSSNFGALLDAESGKLSNNWVRAAMLCIDRDANSYVDIEEAFYMLAADDGKTIGKEGLVQLVDTMTNCDKTAEEIFGDASELTFDGLLRKWRAAGFTLEEKKGDEKGRFQFLGRVIPSKGSAAPSWPWGK